jgi:histone H3/H4
MQSQPIKLNSYIHKLVPKGKRIASEAVNVIEKYLNETYDRLSMESYEMTGYQKKRTLAAKEIQMSLGTICLKKASLAKIRNKAINAVTAYTYKHGSKDRRGAFVLGSPRQAKRQPWLCLLDAYWQLVHATHPSLAGQACACCA